MLNDTSILRYFNIYLLIIDIFLLTIALQHVMMLTKGGVNIWIIKKFRVC